MRLRRLTTWQGAAGVTAAVVAALLLARPAAAGPIMLIVIMAGLPALYRVRRQARTPLGNRARTSTGPTDGARVTAPRSPGSAGTRLR